MSLCQFNRKSIIREIVPLQWVQSIFLLCYRAAHFFRAVIFVYFFSLLDCQILTNATVIKFQQKNLIIEGHWLCHDVITISTQKFKIIEREIENLSYLIYFWNSELSTFHHHSVKISSLKEIDILVCAI